MSRFVFALALVATVFMAGAAHADPIVWDGGSGDWRDANWNGGLTALQVLGRVNGVEVGTAGAIGSDVFINSGTVTYDPNEVTGTDSDFRYRYGGTLNIGAGATWQHDSNDNSGFVDGYWTEFDGDAINVNGGTFRRSFSGNQLSGGAFLFGSWRADDFQVSRVNVTNGGLIENDGQWWFGAPAESATGQKSLMTINNGTVDLTGGDNATLDNDGVLLITADLGFFYSHDGTELRGEEYTVNFTGPGTLITDTGGIIAAEQDAFGFWTNRLDGSGDGTTQMSYADLWTMGILRAKGATIDAGGDLFNKYFSVTGTPGAADYTLTSTVPTAQIVWDGGDGDWRDANWNGGQTAQSQMGRTNGIEFGDTTAVGTDVVINSGTVTYDPNEVTGTDSDFRYRRAGTLTINSGATLQMDSNDNSGFVDGYWTEFDGEAINVNGGTFRRTFSGNQISGGAMILGSWRSFDGQNIEVNVTNGGRIENDGQWWFGAPADNGQIDVTMTINNGDVDLTGGDNATLDNDGVLLITADLGFFYSHDGTDPKGENYAINFTGSGTLTVDQGGIIAAQQDAFGFWTNKLDGSGDGTTLVTYEQLWDMGILQSQGLSGLDGGIFGDWFSVTGSSGSDDYILTSLLVSVMFDEGDFDEDGDVDGDDFLAWQSGFGTTSGATKADGDYDNDGDVDGDDFLGWQSEFGNGGGSGAVPEPTSVLLALIAAAGLATIARRRS